MESLEDTSDSDSDSEEEELSSFAGEGLTMGYRVLFLGGEVNPWVT